MKTKNLGSIPLPILAELEEKFPEVTPGPSDTIQSIMYHAGCRYVVKYLLDTYDPRGERRYA